MSTATAAALEHAGETFEETLLECAYCPPDDNRRGEPPAVCIDCGTSTTASGRQFHDRPVGPLCSACYLARRDARRRAAA